MIRKEQACLISNSLIKATNDIEDVLVENKVESIVAFSIGNILGELQARVDKLLDEEVITNDN